MDFCYWLFGHSSVASAEPLSDHPTAAVSIPTANKNHVTPIKLAQNPRSSSGNATGQIDGTNVSPPATTTISITRLHRAPIQFGALQIGWPAHRGVLDSYLVVSIVPLHYSSSIIIFRELIKPHSPRSGEGDDDEQLDKLKLFMMMKMGKAVTSFALTLSKSELMQQIK
ncbi:GntR family transcriptional regulator [Striga asiatica]|uniref:GntR family transcriptional regulator n=1 Tax=Striga asiatica TaxID=4170 RepID=A0A5A7P9V0_STRAF|nr:GntR family transcriptional regulator [Striga asiatica]